MILRGWGQYSSIDAKVFLPASKSQLSDAILTSSLIPRGLGRSYGDSALNSIVLQTNYLDHFIHFDKINGILTCEAGVSINAVLALIVPNGWFMPVTPGTSFVTIGGAIASDVHGKNHHLSGTLSQHIAELELMLGNGDIVSVSKSSNPDLFYATCGGMGLTGLILSAKIILKPIKSSKISQMTIKTSSLDETLEQFEVNASSTYSVAWIDCLAKGRHLGRSLLMLGEHSNDGELEFLNKPPFSIAFDMPSGLLNKYSIKSFNALYYKKAFKKYTSKTLQLSSYFYPLDRIGNWNRLYGKAGFIQYQFVVPREGGVDALRSILKTISDSGLGSFLAVLKTFGEKNNNFLSFPINGYTLALDFKFDLRVIELIEKLDLMVIGFGGKVYLTKDTLLSEFSFKAMYPDWEQFEMVRNRYHAHGKFSSNQSRRLGLQ